MNATPHTHHLKIEEHKGAQTAIRVQYGDQPSHYVYTRYPGWRSRIRRVARRMIRHHDRHSLKAGRRAEATATLTSAVTLYERSGTWGRDALRTRTPLPRIEATLTHEATGYWTITSPEFLLTDPRLQFSYKDAALKCAAERGYTLTEAPSKYQATQHIQQHQIVATIQDEVGIPAAYDKFLKEMSRRP